MAHGSAQASAVNKSAEDIPLFIRALTAREPEEAYRAWRCWYDRANIDQLPWELLQIIPTLGGELADLVARRSGLGDLPRLCSARMDGSPDSADSRTVGDRFGGAGRLCSGVTGGSSHRLAAESAGRFGAADSSSSFGGAPRSIVPGLCCPRVGRVAVIRGAASGRGT